MNRALSSEGALNIKEQCGQGGEHLNTPPPIGARDQMTHGGHLEKLHTLANRALSKREESVRVGMSFVAGSVCEDAVQPKPCHTVKDMQIEDDEHDRVIQALCKFDWRAYC